MIDPADARLRLERAISAGECPEQPDQVDDVVAHRALLRARLELLTATANVQAGPPRVSGGTRGSAAA